jgi:hypothetical protein
MADGDANSKCAEALSHDVEHFLQLDDELPVGLAEVVLEVRLKTQRTTERSTQKVSK